MTFELRIDPDGLVWMEIADVAEMPESILLAIVDKVGDVALKHRDVQAEVIEEEGERIQIDQHFTAATTPEEQDYTSRIPEEFARRAREGGGT